MLPREMADSPIYKDSRIAVYNDRVVVYKYNSVVYTSKTLMYSEIDQIEVTNKLNMFELKAHGRSSFGNIWWAFHWFREFKSETHLIITPSSAWSWSRIGCTPKQAIEAGEAIVGAMQQYKPGFRLIRSIT